MLLRGTTRDGDPGKDEGKGFVTSLELNSITDIRVSEIRKKLGLLWTSITVISGSHRYGCAQKVQLFPDLSNPYICDVL